jgi:hypothetical protein
LSILLDNAGKPVSWHQTKQGPQNRALPE